MSKPIDGDIVRTLRSLRRWSQTELAGRAKINKDTLSRVERGRQSGGGKVIKALARAFEVAPAVLTGEAPIAQPEEGAENGLFGQPYRRLPTRLDDATHNAFTLVSLRYGVPVDLIADVAPFLFVLAAERSLDRRRRLVGELEARLDEADGIASDFFHLPNTFLPSHALHEMLNAEKTAISELDILADKLAEDSIWSFHINRDDYEQGEHNPFVRSLQEEANDADVASITSVSVHGADYKVCRPQALLAAGGDGGLADAIVMGIVPLSDVPQHLWRPAAIDERLAWMRDRVAAHRVRAATFLAEFDLILSKGSNTVRSEGTTP